MKMLRLLMLVLVVLSMMAFACKAKVKVEADPIDTWAADVKTLVETWEIKAGEGKITDAQFEEYAAAKSALMQRAQTLDLEAKATEAQTTVIQDLNGRMDKLDNVTIPKAMK